MKRSNKIGIAIAIVLVVCVTAVVAGVMLRKKKDISSSPVYDPKMEGVFVKCVDDESTGYILLKGQKRKGTVKFKPGIIQFQNNDTLLDSIPNGPSLPLSSALTVKSGSYDDSLEGYYMSYVRDGSIYQLLSGYKFQIQSANDFSLRSTPSYYDCAALSKIPTGPAY